MRVAVIYRPRNAPPFELMPQLMQGMAEWVDRYQDRMETTYFFAGGGGFGVLDIDDSSELQRILAEHPFTPFADVEIRPVVDPGTALKTLQEVFAARAATG
ncbi:MAG: DUF3303 family protein [Nocardioidaceae bacterium]